jgi:hypothetical protein
VKQYDNLTVTADIDEISTGASLLDPLVFAFCFTPHNDLLVQPNIVRNLMAIHRFPLPRQRPAFAHD